MKICDIVSFCAWGVVLNYLILNEKNDTNHFIRRELPSFLHYYIKLYRLCDITKLNATTYYYDFTKSTSTRWVSTFHLIYIFQNLEGITVQTTWKLHLSREFVYLDFIYSPWSPAWKRGNKQIKKWIVLSRWKYVSAGIRYGRVQIFVLEWNETTQFRLERTTPYVTANFNFIKK